MRSSELAHRFTVLTMDRTKDTAPLGGGRVPAGATGDQPAGSALSGVPLRRVPIRLTVHERFVDGRALRMLADGAGAGHESASSPRLSGTLRIGAHRRPSAPRYHDILRRTPANEVQLIQRAAQGKVPAGPVVLAGRTTARARAGLHHVLRHASWPLLHSMVANRLATSGAGGRSACAQSA
jgi:hypothetical protein